ncbi:MAG: IS1182 family transposase [Verrucomicrobiota bacterium]
MMGVHEPQKELFSFGVDLDKRVRRDNPLRRIKEKVDFSWVRQEVEGTYGSNGHVSADPVTVVKLMFLLFWDGVRSERELMRIVPERLDYLWFLDFGLDDAVPGHSVLSKARARWGNELFEKLFVHTVRQCTEEGLVGGKVLHADGSLVVADASKDSVVRGPEELIDALRTACGAQVDKLEGYDGDERGSCSKKVNSTLTSTTDLDAPVVRRSKPGAKGDPRPCYKNHRTVDDRCGVITATETTAGDVEENRLLETLVSQHEANCEKVAQTLVADAQYGTLDNFRRLGGRGYETHMAIINARVRKDREGLFGPECFTYDEREDQFICPEGQRLYRRSYVPGRRYTEYGTRKGVCASCPMRTQCTRSQTGRTLKRHDGQEIIDRAQAQARSSVAKKNRIRRRWLMEGSFGQAVRHHFKRSRYDNVGYFSHF